MFRLLKSLHFLGLAMFLGSILAYIVIAAVPGSESDLAAIDLHRRMVAAMTWWLTVPGMWLVVLSGVAMAVIGKVGFFRSRWLTTKLILAVIIVVNGTFVLVPTVGELTVLAAQGLAGGELPQAFPGLSFREDMFGAVNMLLILVSLAVAVFRPGRRGKEAAPADNGEAGTPRQAPRRAIRAGLVVLIVALGGLPIAACQSTDYDFGRFDTWSWHGGWDVDSKLASLESKLAITESQLPQWNAVADVVRREAERLRGGKALLPGHGREPVKATLRLARWRTFAATGLDALDNFMVAFEDLYAVLGEEQRRRVDKLFGGRFWH